MRAFNIASHRELQDARSVYDLWNIYGNACADKAAVDTRKTDLPEFHQVCLDVKCHYDEEKKILGQIYNYLSGLC